MIKLKNHPLTFLITFLMLVSLSGCEVSKNQSIHDLPFQALKLFPQGKSFSGFELTSHHNKSWQAADFKGAFSVVFFGFVNCPDICPTTLLELQKVNKKLKEKNSPSPRFIFISVDSDRDTPEVLNEYINFFNPEFYALTGDAPNILSITSQIGVAYHIEDHQPDDLFYNVDHASALFLLNPEGERIGVFTPPLDIEAITHDLALLMESA